MVYRWAVREQWMKCKQKSRRILDPLSDRLSLPECLLIRIVKNGKKRDRSSIKIFWISCGTLSSIKTRRNLFEPSLSVLFHWLLPLLPILCQIQSSRMRLHQFAPSKGRHSKLHAYLFCIIHLFHIPGTFRKRTTPDVLLTIFSSEKIAQRIRWIRARGEREPTWWRILKRSSRFLINCFWFFLVFESL